MDDLNFLHKAYDKDSARQLSEDDLKIDFPELYLKPTVYLVEDDKLFGLSLKKYLNKVLDCPVELFTNSYDCQNTILSRSKADPFCLVTDISLESGPDGLLLIDSLREKGLKFISIAMTGFASIETAIAATKKGVYHYLTKPFELDDLRTLIIKGTKEILQLNIVSSEDLQNKKSIKNKLQLGLKLEQPTSEDIFAGMIGRSKLMKDVFDRINKIALTESTVLITGPSGTGKELVANAIHQLSSRNNNSKISVNCGAIPGELLESELFGHIKGSFTGAISDRKGRFEMANQGTIFLDEIGDMPLHLQVKLLRVLQQRIIEPVGSMESRKIDVRVIAATHRDLEAHVKEGKFREDLYYRLNVIPLRIPALRERREDVPLMIAHFIERFISADRSNEIHFTDEALEMLLTYDWPGNVRELENVIERLVILRGGNTIEPEDLPAKIFKPSLKNSQPLLELPGEGLDLKKVLSDIEDSLINQALSVTGGNKNQASRLLSLNRTTLIEKMKKKSLIGKHFD
jgi:DNA-binding NtrC family response regulator